MIDRSDVAELQKVLWVIAKELKRIADAIDKGRNDEQRNADPTASF